MKATITVYSLTLTGSVSGEKLPPWLENVTSNYPSNKKAEDAQETLKAFDLVTEITKTKKTVEL